MFLCGMEQEYHLGALHLLATFAPLKEIPHCWDVLTSSKIELSRRAAVSICVLLLMSKLKPFNSNKGWIELSQLHKNSPAISRNLARIFTCTYHKPYHQKYEVESVVSWHSASNFEVFLDVTTRQFTILSLDVIS